MAGNRVRQLRWAGLAALALLVTACSGGTPPAPTVKVDRGPVSTSVSASGTLVSVNDQNLGFADRGRLAEVMVKVGDTVKAGQPLARIDDGALTQALESARAKLAGQQASLDKITGGNSVEAAQASLDSARAILDATQDNVDAVNAANSSATERARVQLNFDRQVLEQERRKGCATTTAPPAGGGSARSSAPTTTAPPAADDDDSGGLLGMGEPATTAQVRPVAFSAPLTDDVSSCPNVQSAQRTVLLSETALDQAENAENTAATQGRISVANARRSVVDAESQLDGAGRDKPADTAVQAASVRDALLAVDGATRDLENATLRAPVDGTVSAINGSVGEFLAAAGGATSQAPGSTARLPAATGGTDAAAASSSAGSASGGAFITLTDIDTFQLVVPFEESDAAQVTPNQKVDVSIDALPGVIKPGTVVAVAPTADTISGVVSYYATIVLNETDPRLKDGQTAQADVLTRTVEKVLRVPSSVVRQEGGRSLVTVPGPDGVPIPVPVTPGLEGTEFTEITSGLQEGQEVVVPQATVTATQGGGPNGRGGG